MLNFFARASVSRLSDPVGAWLLKRGLTPNAVTVVGAVGSTASALWLIPAGHLFAGAVVMALFVLFDLIDGSMARAQGGGTPFGAVLDATCDRVTDGALFAAIAWWAFTAGERPIAVAALVCLVGAQVISYVKARAEASGLSADGGLAERAERCIIALTGVGLHGLGVPYVLPVAMYALVALVVATVVQRLLSAARSARELDPARPAPGTSEEGTR
ncbi:CDP-alcohol phosphatidyltransferase family protein [Actinosynnema pretiosum subsp. pretiosum]|uniref:Phosphatidylinositol phosphate synthase n=2 Tax=Actinosynnema TaxID=40566 RepID=C6WGW9_ACTMD|nr:CDP-alcohol phosphatidyltransferase family protein [Actinosynnema mirum]ACU36037.1 CDP-alcohol phosphatidyltransferase [Actinosynnema mirum DSM 43827]AXX29490.1 CDP-diacylglycerol--glycerol-3-phosphate 3-phosphatidyltransferase [Actinosynnema pretiosum subsp. pretiosum]QUF06270.1 CDP-alcohol phosphatidyltransferase family protein [Actinosynnema pretiosum subsp. pretiosum]